MGHFILQFLHTYSYADPVLIVPKRSSQHLLENQKQTATKQQHQQQQRRRRRRQQQPCGHLKFLSDNLVFRVFPVPLFCYRLDALWAEAIGRVVMHDVLWIGFYKCCSTTHKWQYQRHPLCFVKFPSALISSSAFTVSSHSSLVRVANFFSGDRCLAFLKFPLCRLEGLLS